jgi:hypothetical protein
MSASPSLPLWDWLPLASARTDLPPGRSPRGQIRIPLPLPKEASPAASPSAPRPGPAGRLARRTALVANGPSGREAFPEAKRGLGARHAAGPGRGSPQGGSDGCPPASFARHLPFPRAIHATEPSKRRAGSHMTRANPRTLSRGGYSQKAPPRPQPPGRGMERGDPAASTDSPKAKWKPARRTKARKVDSRLSGRTVSLRKPPFPPSEEPLHAASSLPIGLPTPERPLSPSDSPPPPPQPLPNRLRIIRRIRIHHLRPRPRPPPPALLHPQAPQHLLQPTAVALIPRPHHHPQGKPIFIHPNARFRPFSLLMPIDSYTFPPFFASTRVESIATASTFTFPSVYPQSRRACRIWCQIPFS